MFRSHHALAGVLSLSFALTGCMADLADVPQDELEQQESALSIAPILLIRPLQVRPRSPSLREAGMPIVGDTMYERVFGAKTPRDIDWQKGDVVLLYSAGQKPTGGYEASFVHAVRLGNRINVVTKLVEPGDDCVTTQALTVPYAVGVLRVPTLTPPPLPRPQPLPLALPNAPITFTHLHETEACEVDAGTGEQDAGASEDAGPSEDAPRCGGIAAFPCPGVGECVDDPRDSCDPRRGGADCGGLCECTTREVCARGERWDSSPDVCACVPLENPCAVTLCPLTERCEVNEAGRAECVPFWIEG